MISRLLCKNCKKNKPLADFSPKGNGKLNMICKPCRAKEAKLLRKRRKKGFESEVVISKRCTSCKVEKSASEYRRNFNRTDFLDAACKKCRRVSQVKKRYGISLTEYEKLMNRTTQCELCGRSFGEKFFQKVYDHDHITGLFRGVIHRRCNSVIGMMEDNPELLRKAAQYLEER